MQTVPKDRQNYPWTPAEMDLLQAVFKTGSIRQIQEQYFPHRTINAVESKAKQIGLRKSRPQQALIVRCSRAERIQRGLKAREDLAELIPDGPTDCPTQAMRGVIYENVVSRAGDPVKAAMLGKMLPRIVAHQP